MLSEKMSDHVRENGDGPDDALAATTDVLVRTLRALGKSGRPDEASRLAAKAYIALRDGRPREADRINGVMHFLAKLPPEPDAPPIHAPAATTSGGTP